MATDSELAVAFANRITGTPESGVVRDLVKALIDQMEVALGLLFAPSFDRVIPDRLEVRERLGPKSEISH